MGRGREAEPAPEPEGKELRGADAAVWAEGLTYRYGTFVAVRGIDLAVRRGECFGLLGPNGAGKTTTIRMITCRVPPSDGVLVVAGLDVRRFPSEVKARLGVVNQQDNLDEAISVQENLEIYGQCFGLSVQEARRRAQELLALMGLEARGRARPRELSGGMKRRLVIARALINRPDIVVLDEPTTGLDPHARALVWDRLARLKSQRISLILTTHYMEEAARLCDRIAIMDQGRIIALGEPGELVERYAGPGGTLEDVFLALTGRGLLEGGEEAYGW